LSAIGRTMNRRRGLLVRDDDEKRLSYDGSNLDARTKVHTQIT
jgi:hypothetical protein